MQPIKITAFGPICSLLGGSEVILTCNGPLQVSAILEELQSRYPLFSIYLGQPPKIHGNLMIGSGSREMKLTSMVQPGQELVLVTPISGG